MENYILEAFQKLSLLKEDDFDITADRDVVDELQSFVADDVEEIPEEPVIDLDAESEDELADNYVGKVILECECCHTRIYKEESEVFVDEESGLANIEEECPVCNNTMGYTVIGKIEKFDEEPVDDDDEDEEEIELENDPMEDEEEESPIESLRMKIQKRRESLSESKEEEPDPWGGHEDKCESKEDVCPECGKNPCVCEKCEDEEESLKEGIENLSLDTDDTHVEMNSTEDGGATVSVEPKIDDVEFPGDDIPADLSGDEEIVPLSDEEEEEILANEPEGEEDEFELEGEPLEEPVGDEEELTDEEEEEEEEEELPEESLKTEGEAVNESVEGVNLNEGLRDVFLIIGAVFGIGAGIVRLYTRAAKVAKSLDEVDELTKFAQEMNALGKQSDPESEFKSKCMFATLCAYATRKTSKPIRYIQKQMEDNAYVYDCDYGRWVEFGKYEREIDRALDTLKLDGYGIFSVKETVPGKTQTMDDVLDRLLPDRHKDNQEESVNEDFDEFGDSIDVEGMTKEEILQAASNEHLWALGSDDQAEAEMHERNADLYRQAAADMSEGMDIDEFDESKFNDLCESYLRKVYENVNTFITESVKDTGDNIIVEGIIKFKNDKQMKSRFVFTEANETKSGKIVLEGFNETFSKQPKSFKVKGTLKNNNYISESMSYNYTVKSLNEGKTEKTKVVGRVRTNK